MRTHNLLPVCLLVLGSLAQAQMVRGGLWAYESLDGDESSYPGLTVTREVIEASRLNGVRIDAAGRMTHMCWKPHRLGAGDKATLKALGEGARIEYVNVSETAYEDITTSTHGRTHSRWRWVGHDCGELVAWEPPPEDNERRPEREKKADRIAAAPANGQADTRTPSRTEPAPEPAHRGAPAPVPSPSGPERQRVADPAPAPLPPSDAITATQRRRMEADAAAQRAEQAAQLASAEESAADAANEQLQKQMLAFVQAFTEGRSGGDPQAQLEQVARFQRELAAREQRRQRAAAAADAARERARQLRAQADASLAEEERLAAAEKRAAQQKSQPTKPAPAPVAAQAQRPASSAGGAARTYYAVGVIYEKQHKQPICSDGRLVVNTEFQSTKKEGRLVSEIRSDLRRRYPHSAHLTWSVEVVPQGQSLIVFQVEKSLLGYSCKDTLIRFARGKTMAEAESKLANLPRSERLLEVIQRWPVGLDAAR